MNKRAMAVALSVFSLASQAGSMGPVSTDDIRAVPYISGEGSYTWNSLKGFVINGFPTSMSKNGWGGRLSVGIDRPYTETFSLNAEIGGGYYGTTALDNDSAGVKSAVHISGYDFLAGGTYHTQYIDLFGDFGFMAQTLVSTMERNLSKRVPGGVFSGISTTQENQTHIMPEIKVGAAYNLINNLSLTLAYLHAFGSSITGNIYAIGSDSPPTGINIGGSLSARNPSLDSIFLGLRYHFV